MANMKKVEKQELMMGKLRYGRDLLEELTELCVKENIQLGRIEALGAVQKAVLGYYDQERREYDFLTLDQHLEITNLVANVSIKDGKPFVHAHITLADNEGRAYGGHLSPGTIVFACEFILESLKGPEEVLTKKQACLCGKCSGHFSLMDRLKTTTFYLVFDVQINSSPAVVSTEDVVLLINHITIAFFPTLSVSSSWMSTITSLLISGSISTSFSIWTPIPHSERLVILHINDQLPEGFERVQ